MISFSEPHFLLLATLAIPMIYLAFNRRTRFKKVTSATKAGFIILIAAALASPSITVSEERNTQDRLVILEDNSRSAELLEEVKLDFENIETERRTIASGNSSDLSAGILQNVEEDKSYLLISDLQSSDSMKGTTTEIRKRNASVNLLKPETEDEYSIKIEGPDTTYPGAENTFTVRVKSNTDNIPIPQISLNGEPVENEKVQGEDAWQVTKTFEKEGYNTIQASIAADDRFSDNNQYFKAVEVTEKPEILVLGGSGRISQEFSDFYSFDHHDTIPEDLSPYYAVIAKKPFEPSQLAGYTAEGNGLIYTGEYEQENQILPVSKTDNQQSQGAKIVLAIDVSYSAGNCVSVEGDEPGEDYLECGEGTVKESIQIAYSLIDTLPYINRVGVVAFNDKAIPVSQIAPLSENREDIKNSLSRVQTSGSTYYHKGLRGGKEMLDGSGNLILITDGQAHAASEGVNSLEKSRDIASNLGGTKLITVGVGEERNKKFLRDLAKRGNGKYLDARDSGRLRFQFAAGGTESEAETLYVVDKEHFITRDIEAEGTLSAFDAVEPKSSARTLVTSDQGKPFLTTWRYGLGRVAAFSGGEDDLGATMYRDSDLVSRTLSWAAGEPQRKEQERIDIENTEKGETVQVTANYPVEELDRQNENRYTGTLEPEKLGFHQFKDAIYGYNYNSEVDNIGYNDAEEFASSAGGTVFTPDQKEKIEESVQEFNNEKIEKQREISNYFLAAALLVFLSEIGYRKRRGKK
ncbi:MAG: hypothetical protein ACI9LV_000946 [Candidatus Nanohaloarchaea archaeon]